MLIRYRLISPESIAASEAAKTNSKIYQDLRNWHISRVRQISTICLLTAFRQSDAPYKTYLM